MKLMKDDNNISHLVQGTNSKIFATNTTGNYRPISAVTKRVDKMNLNSNNRKYLKFSIYFQYIVFNNIFSIIIFSIYNIL